LRASGLRTEVRRQYALGGVVLATAGVTTVPARTVTYGTGPQTPTSANALSSIGFHHVLVDGTSLAEDPSSTLDWGYAFRFADAPHGPTALASDTELSALSDDTTADPGLVASQLLGELAFLHFEEPDLVAPRAVVLVTDATRAVSTAFVGNVLQGLRGNPVLAPVTASAAFRDVPVGPPGFPATRALALGPSAPLGGATSSYVQSLRIQIEDLRSAVTSTASPVPALEGALLSAEAVGPTVSARRLLLDHVHGLLADQQGYFRIYDGTITLTESGATLPITVFSSAPYSVKCTLVLSSGKLVFPMDHGHHSTAVPVTLSGNPYSVRVSARALVTGDLPLTAELYSPDGRFVLAHALITVRATGTSVVGIVLTVVALLVLALWWLRTSRKRRAVR
ncbi:MAG TPA: hypothetical protein VKT18_03280, partial [Acidimicrobiales bacterium]|nr:hypothetical protein [Acidimicrobiales bacterium]